MKFRVNLPFGSGKEVQNGFPIRISLAFFHLKVFPISPIRFQVNLPFCSGKGVQNIFSHLGLRSYPIGKILAIFDLQDAPILKFKVIWPFSSDKKKSSK